MRFAVTGARWCGWTIALAVAAACAWGVETPTSYGEAAKVDTPILRIPFMKTPPKLDGVMTEGEWEDSSALSGFWYDYSQADFRFLAAAPTQVQVYLGYDKEYLYIAYCSPVYPENSWLKARARFPDVIAHPLYGLQWDDHVELEIRPYHDNAKAFQLGLYKWFINPINTCSDQYWSINQGEGKSWDSKTIVRCDADGKRWTIEIAVPLKHMVQSLYAGKDDKGQPWVTLPPPDGTIYRAWFTRAIGGNGDFFYAWDAHCWNTTKTQIIFDSQAPSCQLNDLGPIMEDTVDTQLTVKNHNTRSETVRLGFFVESAEGTIFSSYESPELKEGLLELRPGEVRKIRLRQPFPGISTDGNVLWFDVRSAGRPAKTLYRTRLVRFHSMDGGFDERSHKTYRERRLDIIATLRPPRKDFDFHFNFSSYTNSVSGIVDLGIHGASEEAKRAKEAKLTIMKNNQDEDVVGEIKSPVRGDFACFVEKVPKLVAGESYKASLLLFDDNRRIVGERNLPPFTYEVAVWQNTKVGTDDVVWEPFTPMRRSEAGFETLNHRFTVGPTGLPSQIYIKPDLRDLPLEKRAAGALTDAELQEFGRGPQLRAPFRLVATVGGKPVEAKVLTPAKLVREWQSELEYTAKLDVGGVPADLTIRYDCDGSLQGRLDYGGDAPVKLDRLELVSDIEGTVDLALSASNAGGMAAADTWECSLPATPGIIWDSAKVERVELVYSHFIPWFWFGSADRAFTWFAASNEGWLLDRDGSTITLERDAAGKVTFRVLFVNHPVEVKGRRQIVFTLMTHPAKPKPQNSRLYAWQFCGGWADGYAVEPMDLSDEYLKERWRTASSAPKDLPYEKANTWRKDTPPWHRYGRWRNVGTCPELDQIWQDKGSYHYERHIRIGRRVGGWMDEYWAEMHPSDNLAMGNAYLRDPADVKEKEIPWQRQWLTYYMRGFYKRIAREYQRNNVPNRNCTWANNASTMLESFIWDCMLVEECGAGHRSQEIDVVIQFPASLYRYLCHNWSGVITRVVADVTPVMPGDDKRFDRQHFGRALLNDTGVNFSGPHGVIQHKEQAIRLINALTEFGFFQDQEIEKLPYWRNGRFVQCGPAADKVYVSAYRRPLPEGKGYKAFFVIMNESDKPVQVPLTISDPTRILGGKNTLTPAQVYARTKAAPDLAEWWQAATAAPAPTPVLMDLETGDVVARQPGDAEVYGPIYVPYHEYRVLYAQSEK